MISIKKIFTLSVFALLLSFFWYVYISVIELISSNKVSYQSISFVYPYIEIKDLHVNNLKIDNLKVKLKYLISVSKIYANSVSANYSTQEILNALKKNSTKNSHNHSLLSSFLLPDKIIIKKFIYNSDHILSDVFILSIKNYYDISFQIPKYNNIRAHLNFTNKFSYCDLFILNNNKEIVNGSFTIVRKNFNNSTLIGKLNFLNQTFSIASHIDNNNSKLQSVLKSKYINISTIVNYKQDINSTSNINILNKVSVLLKINKISDILHFLCIDTKSNDLLSGTIDIKNYKFNFSSNCFYMLKNFEASYRNKLLNIKGNIDSINFDLLANISFTDDYISLLFSNTNFSTKDIKVLSNKSCILFNKQNLSFDSNFDIRTNYKDHFRIKSSLSLNKFLTTVEIDTLEIFGKLFTGISKIYSKNGTLINETNIKSKDNFIQINNLNENFGLKIFTPKSHIKIYLYNKKSTYDIIKSILKKQISVIGRLFLPEFIKIVTSGDLNIDIKYDNNKKFYGTIELMNLNIMNHILGIILKNGYAKFSGEKNLFNTEKTSCIYDKYQNVALFSGKLQLKNILDFNNAIQLNLKNFCLTRNSSLFLAANGILKMQGNQSFQKITGNLETSKALFNLLDVSNDFKNITFKKEVTIKNRNDEKPYIDFNIKIKTDNLKITGDNFEIILYGLLTLVNSGNTIVGKLYAYKHKGFFEVLKQKLDVKSGYVLFKKEYPFDPIFELKTKETINDIILQVNIKKDQKDFQYSMSSVPEMSQENILAKILFNKTIDKLSSTDWIQIAYLMQIKNSILFKRLDNIGQKIGIDDIKFEKNTDQESGMLKLEKKFKNDIRISVENNINNNTQEIRIKKPISKNFSGEISTNGDIGISYKYRY